MKSTGIWLGWIWFCVESLWMFVSAIHPPMSSLSTTLKALAVAGGPVIFLVSLVLAVQKDRAAGALLWLGAATAAMAFALGSGSSLGAYFTGFLMVVAPQAVVGTLLIRAGVQRERRDSAFQRRPLR